MNAARTLCVALAAIGLSGCASTVKPTEKKNLGSAAVAPLKDLGIVRPEAPKQLSDIQYPYDSARLDNGCPQIRYEIEALNKLLGAESYAAAPAKSGGEQAKDAAGGVVVGVAENATTSFIPFRGVVRGVTGAAARDAEVERAVLLGIMRRSYLRGYGLALECDGVMPPGSVPPNQPPPPSVPAEQLRQQPPEPLPAPVAEVSRTPISAAP